MSDQAWIGCFAASGLGGQIEWERYEWAFVESPWETQIYDLRDGGGRPEAESTLSGVLFGTACEFRWRKKRDGLFHCVAIRDDEPAELEGWREVKRIGESHALLWGEPDEEIWWESRIPREIREYPRELRGKRVRMMLAEYEFRPDEHEPPVMISRLKGFEGA